MTLAVTEAKIIAAMRDASAAGYRVYGDSFWGGDTICCPLGAVALDCRMVEAIESRLGMDPVEIAAFTAGFDGIWGGHTSPFYDMGKRLRKLANELNIAREEAADPFAVQEKWTDEERKRLYAAETGVVSDE